jgi:hypothetical protein
MKEFITADVYLAAIIVCILKISPTYKTAQGKVLFVFPASDDLYRTINLFNNGIDTININAFELIQIIKRLRSEMLTRKNMSFELSRRHRGDILGMEGYR